MCKAPETQNQFVKLNSSSSNIMFLSFGGPSKLASAPMLTFKPRAIVFFMKPPGGLESRMQALGPATPRIKI